MEKNIKILGWFIELCKHNELGFDKEVQAIESLIKGYKELAYKYNKAMEDLVTAEHENKTLKGFVSEVFNEGDE